MRRGRVPKVLIIDDEPAIVENIVYALTTEGFAAVRAGTGGEGLALVEGERPDLVILDIGLPDMDGFELCRRIRQRSAVPVIFLTARTGEIDRVVGLEIGGDDYVVKPFSPRELAARVKAVLRRAVDRPAHPAAAPAVPFTVDAERQMISFRGRPLALTRYEFRLLKLLVRRPGWVFSRDQLLEAVWEEPDASLGRTVDTHIKTLRAKLHAIDPAVDPIETHRGLGYALREAW
jgi:two-component system, OmpR family, catabolic regulation response regulator CreB